MIISIMYAPFSICKGIQVLVTLFSMYDSLSTSSRTILFPFAVILEAAANGFFTSVAA